jgi:hypothetical protein
MVLVAVGCHVSSGDIRVKHRRGIDLAAPFPPKDYREHAPVFYDTLASLKEWEVLGGKCEKCGHISWLDKKAVERQIGNHYLMNVRQKLTCQCGNKEGNRVLIGKLGRD